MDEDKAAWDLLFKQYLAFLSIHTSHPGSKRLKEAFVAFLRAYALLTGQTVQRVRSQLDTQLRTTVEGLDFHFELEIED